MHQRTESRIQLFTILTNRTLQSGENMCSCNPINAELLITPIGKRHCFSLALPMDSVTQTSAELLSSVLTNVELI